MRVAELFAGVGGFRLALEPEGFKFVWANQWEPATKKQHAATVYDHHWPGQLVNRDVHEVAGEEVPDHDLLVGGFPCQDYSPLASVRAKGLEGAKGALWWEVARLIEAKRRCWNRRRANNITSHRNDSTDGAP